MPDADAPQVEPLALPLEEALAKLGERGYTLAVFHHKGAPEYVLCDMYSSFARGSFGHWKDAVEAVLGVPVVPFPFEDAIASIGDLGLVITRLPTGSWAIKDPHSDDCWFGPTLIGALEAVLPELGAPRDPTAELEARDD